MTFATFLGALIPTAIVSRIFLLVTKRWEGGVSGAPWAGQGIRAA